MFHRAIVLLGAMALSNSVYNLYLDTIFTKYYLLALSEERSYYVCPISGGQEKWAIFDDTQDSVQSLFVPPFFHLAAKSLSSHPECLAFTTHQEGFLPGSVIVTGPVIRSQWTISYSGRLAFHSELPA